MPALVDRHGDEHAEPGEAGDGDWQPGTLLAWRAHGEHHGTRGEPSDHRPRPRTRREVAEQSVAVEDERT